MRALLRIAAAAVALFGLVANGSLAADPSFPDFTAPVVDAAHVLSSQDEAALDDQLLALQKKTGTQFAVAIIPSLDGEEIEPYANALFRQWKIGQKDVNNGLLLVLAMKEHRLRFEVGYGLEGTMTDLQSKLIITNTMVPKLKAGDAAGAVKAGVDDAIKVLTGDAADAAKPPVAAADQPLDAATFIVILGFALFVFLVIFFMIWRMARRKGSRWSWAAGAGAASTWSSGDNSSSGGGGDSGFSGGGGGDSGGGGASGSW